MRKQTLRWTILLVTGLALFAVLQGNIPLQAKAADDFPKPVFNDKGELLRPDISYREWIYIGTPLTPNDLNPPEAPFPEFHNVYIQHNLLLVVMKQFDQIYNHPKEPFLIHQ